MKKKESKTTSVRLETDVIEVARKHKQATGCPISYFIEDAVRNQVEKLPVQVKRKMGLIK